jgi:hypothetical protein
MSNVIDIHIHRAAAGKEIPFDKVYLFYPKDRLLVPRIFGYAIVLPLTDDFKDSLFKLRPKELSRKHFYRNDGHLHIPTEIDDKVINGRSHSREEVAQWWSELDQEIDIGERLVVVPVLTSIVRKKVRPRYLSTKTWFAQQAKRRLKVVQPPLNEFAYLATPNPPPDDAIRPICSVCPRALLHLQGACTPGEDVCYKALDFSEIGGGSTDASVQQNDD